MLVSGKVQVPNGVHNGEDNRHNTYSLRSDDFNKINAFREETDFSTSKIISNYSSSGGYKSKITPPPVAPKPSIHRESLFESKKEPEMPAVLASLKDSNRASTSHEPPKEFGEYSTLVAPALISGGNKATDETVTTTTTRSSITTTKRVTEEEGDSNRLFSTTITKPVKDAPANFLLSDVTSASPKPFQLGGTTASSEEVVSPLTSFLRKETTTTSYQERSSSPLFHREASPVAQISNTNQRRAASPVLKRVSSPVFMASARKRSLSPPPLNNRGEGLENNKEVSFSITRPRDSSSLDRDSKTNKDITSASKSKSGANEYSSTYSAYSESKVIRDGEVVHQSSSSTNSRQLGLPDVTRVEKEATSPKLNSYRGTADKCLFEGETVRHFNAGKLATFQLRAPGRKREDVEVNIISEYLSCTALHH